MTGSWPRISVIIPVLDGERFLAEAIESALGQSSAPAEVVIVDDGSTDGTRGVVARFGVAVRYLHQSCGGPAAARNRGVVAAQGEVFAFLDADDRWTPDALAMGVAALETAEAAELTVGQVVEVSQAGWEGRVAQGPPPPGSGMPGYLPGACLVPRSTWERVGDFDTGLRAGEFIDWYLRARALGVCTRLLSAVVLWRRLHDANLGIRARPAYVDLTRVVKRELDRHKANATLPPGANP